MSALPSLSLCFSVLLVSLFTTVVESKLKFGVSSEDRRQLSEFQTICKPKMPLTYDFKMELCTACHRLDASKDFMFSRGIKKGKFKFSCPDRCFNTTVFKFCKELLSGKEVVVFKLDYRD